MPKEQYRESNFGKRISHVTFQVDSSSEIQQAAHIQVITKNLYAQDGQRVPAQNGVLDRRMGTNQKDAKCDTCGLGLADCVGHFGYIDLALPVFHVGYFRSTIIILQTICKSCAKVLLPKDLKRSFQRKFLKPDLSYLHMKSLRAAVHKKAKGQSKCPSCGAYNGTVKKGSAGILKIVHEVYRGKKPGDPVVQKAIREYNVAVESNRELKAMLNSGLIKELSPVEVLDLFNRIPDEEIPLLGMRVKAGRPVDLILQRLPVPPICIRPSVVSDVKAGTNEDDLTVKQSEIMLINDVIARHIASGGKTELVQEDWDYLQLHTALYINSEMSGIPLTMQPKKPGRGLVQRLKGKQGRFRGNLSGKRVDFSSRTVISPDPNLQIQEVGVPVYVAKVLTYPERVFPANIEWLRQLVRAGPDVHPGANYVQLRAGDAKRYLKYGNREKIAQELKFGDLVERHLVDGDVVLFNRQPSLHKLSIMSHRAKVQPQRTFRFNECVCTPYNADFDGDEMNLHLPQTEEARAEALILMGNKSNLVTPRNGELLIAATQDFITGGYLLTRRDRFLTRTQATRLALALCAGADAGMPLRLPPPAIIKPDQLWTGKQIISLIMRPNSRCEVKLNLEAAGRVYRDQGRDKYITPDDTYVVIRNSEVVCGALDKSTLGSGNKTSLFYALLRDWGEDCAVKAMWRLGRMSSEFLTMLGFSIGIGDVTPTASLLDDRRKLFHSGFAKCDAFMEKAAKGTLEVQMGCTVDQTLEAVMTSELNAVRNAAAASCYRNLRGGNTPLIMAKCGSKGSNDNVAQMIVCLGQQAISGKRMPNGFEQRALPLFKRDSKEPASRGFVQNSFYSGLTPAEFYFHTMCGREGLVDTAVKTADTGYLQRRLVKALEDLVLHYDMTVRNATGDVVQFQYGSDGLDPACMEGQGRPVDLPRALADVCARYPHRDEEPLDGVGIEIAAKETLATSDFNTCPEEFKKEMLSFLGGVAQRVRAVRARYPGSSAVARELERLTLSQLVRFLRAAHHKYQCSTIEPGTAVGALAAQSIGEPGTQMTLKTFHFAGVASMNITQGVPRVKEIINAARRIATPVVTAELRDPTHLENAERVKNRLVKTTLGDVMINMSIYHLPGESYVLVNLDMKYIERMKFEINEETIVYSILTSKMRLRPEQVSVMSEGRVKVSCDLTKNSGWANVTALQMARQLPAVMVAGLAHVARAVVTCSQPGRYKLIVEGDGLRDVMATYGVDPNRTTSNNILEVYQTLGIEAAKSTIISEIQAVMEGHGMCVDRRHVELLAGQMTARGEVLGITRYGLAKMKESVLNLASFEKTADHLFDAAYYGQRDSIEGVSESIILGVPARIGTGLLHLLHDHRGSEPLARRQPVFDQPHLHDTLWE